MQVNPVEVAVSVFVISFLFSLGGLGSAAALVPILLFLNVPFESARPTGLFAGFMSTSSATLHNIRGKHIDYKLALKLAIPCFFFAPVGAYSSTFLPTKVVGLALSYFLFFAGFSSLLKFKTELISNGEAFAPLVGVVAGFISGFLGVGGGVVMSPLLTLLGVEPKKVVSATAFAVAISSLTAFLAYWKLGFVDPKLLIYTGLPAMFAGYLGARVSLVHMNPAWVRKVLGVLFFILGFKLFSMFR